jgi:hypothetical protein
MMTFLKQTITALIFSLLILTSCVPIAETPPQSHSLRAPSVPLITFDPYTSVWSFADHLNEQPTLHWTGREHPMNGLVRVDGTTYRFMGMDPWDVVVPTSVEGSWDCWITTEDPGSMWTAMDYDDSGWTRIAGPVGTSNTIMENGTVVENQKAWIRREFELKDTVNLHLLVRTGGSSIQRMIVYINGHLAGAFQSRHDMTWPIAPEARKSLHPGKNILGIYFEKRRPRQNVFVDVGLVRENAMPKAVQTSVEVRATQSIYSFECGGVSLGVTFTTPLLMEDLTILKTGSLDQPVLEKEGDDLRIDWGHLFVVPQPGTDAVTSIAGAGKSQAKFIEDGGLPEMDDPDDPRSAGDHPVSLAVSLPYGILGTEEVSRFVCIAYDDVYSIDYFGEPLKAWWKRKIASSVDLIETAITQYPSLMQSCREFDGQLFSEAENAGGQEYASLCALAYRQAIAAHKLVEGPGNTPLFLSKENFSNGSIGTVDVTYPSSPLFLIYNPDLLKGMLEPIFHYAESGRWTKPFAAHDVGKYPKANGQRYREDMPVEECGNMVILTAAIARIEGNTGYADKHWETLTEWAEYLKANGFDPENQLCTDDFAGHLASNANLSIKAIVALGAYARLAEESGKEETAMEYRETAEKMAMDWIEAARDGDHYSLTFYDKGTWSQKYNLVWDRLLDLGLFPEEVTRKELEYYQTKQLEYGLPLDSRSDYTKSDWIVWTASMSSDPDDFHAFINPLYRWVNETPTRQPLPDWHNTRNGLVTGFRARSVVGGYFMKMLTERLNPDQ